MTIDVANNAPPQCETLAESHYPPTTQTVLVNEFREEVARPVHNPESLLDFLRIYREDKPRLHENASVHGVILGHRCSEYWQRIDKLSVTSDAVRAECSAGSLRSIGSPFPAANDYGVDVDRGVVIRKSSVLTYVCDPTETECVLELSVKLSRPPNVIIEESSNCVQVNFDSLRFSLAKVIGCGWILWPNNSPSTVPAGRVVASLLLVQQFKCWSVKLGSPDAFTTQCKLLSENLAGSK